MDNFGQYLQELRKEAGLSQSELANVAGLSQPSISRFEASKEPPSDIRLLAKIAKALKRPLADFLPEEAGIGPAEQFFAFCPNPLCRRNTHNMRNGQVFVVWDSWTPYPSEQFAEVNYCPSCGTELTKECPNCKRRFPQTESSFCIRCGEEICNRPTPEEWKSLEELHQPPAEATEDNIPF